MGLFRGAGRGKLAAGAALGALAAAGGLATPAATQAQATPIRHVVVIFLALHPYPFIDARGIVMLARKLRRQIVIWKIGVQRTPCTG